MHREQDEFIYTLHGMFRVRLEADLIEAPPGAFVFIPRSTPHTWQNVGEAHARFVAPLMPASVEFEEFFLRYAELPSEERGIEAFSRIAAETRAMEVVGRSHSHIRADPAQFQRSLNTARRVISSDVAAGCASVLLLERLARPGQWRTHRVSQRQKLGKSLPCRSRSREQKSPVSGAFPVAGAGFEPATSGL